MRKTLLYHGSIAVCGGIIGLEGVIGTLSGTAALWLIPLVVGGIGTVLGAVYEVFLSSDPSASLPDDRVVWFVTVSGVIALLSRGWSLFA